MTRYYQFCSTKGFRRIQGTYTVSGLGAGGEDSFGLIALELVVVGVQ